MVWLGHIKSKKNRDSTEAEELRVSTFAFLRRYTIDCARLIVHSWRTAVVTWRGAMVGICKVRYQRVSFNLVAAITPEINKRSTLCANFVLVDTEYHSSYLIVDAENKKDSST